MSEPTPDPHIRPQRHREPGLGQVMATAGGITIEPRPIDLADLQKSLVRRHTFVSAALSVATVVLTLLALVPLFSVLFMLLWRGGAALSWRLFTQLPPAARMAGGGIGNALLGTMEMVGIAAAISVPFGILAAIYMAEFARDSRLSQAVHFAAKVLTGLPSVLAGLFAYASVVLLFDTYSALAGGIALAVLMIPTVLLTAEQAIKMVPQRMREAAIGMGATPTQVTLKVVLPTALPGVLTGVMLAVARAAGETAPLLFTALFFDYWPAKPMQPTPSLAVLIYDFASSPFENQIQIAWSASLVLVFLVLLANVAAQIWSARSLKK